MLTYLATSDVAKALGLTTNAIRSITQRGGLRVAAKTERGIQLFRRIDVERLAAKRARRTGPRSIAA